MLIVVSAECELVEDEPDEEDGAAAGADEPDEPDEPDAEADAAFDALELGTCMFPYERT